jgi:hypothetical protein
MALRSAASMDDNPHSMKQQAIRLHASALQQMRKMLTTNSKNNLSFLLLREYSASTRYTIIPAQLLIVLVIFVTNFAVNKIRHYMEVTGLTRGNTIVAECASLWRSRADGF